ncbi:MAG TPA: hypothetical protein VFZ65_02235, partial [Planctomycetota bacterium]|nr:hypothetical protein [Planctomycetota bacterium]
DDPRWYDKQAEAVVKFWQTGELPDDDLHLEALLVDVECDLLRAHKRGKDVAEPMALLHRLAHAGGDEGEELLARLSAMAVAGQLA